MQTNTDPGAPRQLDEGEAFFLAAKMADVLASARIDELTALDVAVRAVALVAGSSKLSLGEIDDFVADAAVHVAELVRNLRAQGL
jgi:hypothetical protein